MLGQRTLNRRLIGHRNAYKPHELVNVRMPDDLIEALEQAAADNDRTLRDEIRHILWLTLASRGYLDEEASVAALAN